MFKFLKVLARNLLQGPSTDPFPFKEAPTPQRFRGRVTMDPQKCVGCAICRHVCAGRAIHIQPHEEGAGYDFAIWHNSCALCGMCRHFCPTQAITMTNDWHNAHTQEEKYSWTEHHFVPYLRCAGCDSPMRLLPPDLATRIYAHSPVDMTELMKLCPSCRQIAEAQRLESMARELGGMAEEPQAREENLAEAAPVAAAKSAGAASEAAGPLTPEQPAGSEAGAVTAKSAEQPIQPRTASVQAVSDTPEATTAAAEAQAGVSADTPVTAMSAGKDNSKASQKNAAFLNPKAGPTSGQQKAGSEGTAVPEEVSTLSTSQPEDEQEMPPAEAAGQETSQAGPVAEAPARQSVPAGVDATAGKPAPVKDAAGMGKEKKPAKSTAAKPKTTAKATAKPAVPKASSTKKSPGKKAKNTPADS